MPAPWPWPCTPPGCSAGCLPKRWKTPLANPLKYQGVSLLASALLHDLANHHKVHMLGTLALQEKTLALAQFDVGRQGREAGREQLVQRVG